jgi:ABC-type Mn2+/Zn2+ transport system ATPase subunit
MTFTDYDERGTCGKTGLAARLVPRPHVLLLDEPTTSIDAASAQL